MSVLSVTGTASAGSFRTQIYLPIVQNSASAPFAWQNRASLPYGVMYMGAATVGGKLYVIVYYPSYDGGDNGIHAVLYDPSANTLTLRPGHAPWPGCCFPPYVAGGANGKIYVIDDQTLPGATRLTEEYDPSSDTWTSRAPIPAVANDYYGFTLVGASDGKLYLAGGPPCACNSLIPSNAVLVYDPTADSWTTEMNLLFPEENPSVVVLNGTDVYVVGGWNGLEYDPYVEEATIPPSVGAARLHSSPGG